MKLLSVETSTMLGGVAIIDEALGLVVESRLNVRAAHSERLMSEINAALERSSLTLGDIDALCVCTGPGSFTGLRIGLGAIKGLAFSTGLPVAAVPTLEALAWNFPHSAHPVCPMLDARKGEVYAGLFRTDGGEPVRLVEETSIRPGTLATALGKFEAVVLLGQGAELYRDVFVGSLGKRALLAPPHLGVPSAASAAHLGLARALRGEFTDPAGLSPYYIRKSEAELKAT